MLYHWTQNSNGLSQRASDIICVKSAAYEALPQKSPVYDYVLVNGIRPKLCLEGHHYTEVGQQHLGASSAATKQNEKKPVYSNVLNQTVSYCFWIAMNSSNSIWTFLLAVR